jgi:hypothetical protein
LCPSLERETVHNNTIRVMIGNTQRNEIKTTTPVLE